MVRLWSLEAFAHGATCVSYFRWRQAPFAQEQMHAGLLRPDSSKAEAWPEIAQLADEIADLHLDGLPTPQAAVAIVTDCEASWVSQIERQGDSYDYDAIQRAWYMALRRLGVDVDFIAPDGEMGGYRLILAPSLPILSQATVARLKDSGARVVFGPRSGAKTIDFTVPDGLPPGPLRALLPIRVLSVETIRPGCDGGLFWGNDAYASRGWREYVDPGSAHVIGRYEDGAPAIIESGQATYIACLSDDAFLQAFLSKICAKAGIDTVDLPPDVRLRRRGNLVFAFNYGDVPQPTPAPVGVRFLIGGAQLGPRDVALWELEG